MKQITTTKIKKYREYLIEEEKSKNTIDKYMRDINAFTKWIAERDLCKAEIMDVLMEENNAHGKYNSSCLQYGKKHKIKRRLIALSNL